MNRLRARIQELAKQHGSLRAAARALQLDHGYLSRLQDGLKLEPSDDVLRKLGLKRVVTYEIRSASTRGVSKFPALKDMTTDELVTLMLGCSRSPDPSDREFAKACSKEIARRKPEKRASYHRSVRDLPSFRRRTESVSESVTPRRQDHPSCR